ncbi:MULTISPECIES: MFS transporter [Enterobacterales]|uniref:MFS transporter n=1 Tax=Enterobacterales TaxID=91347 RepID=UPI000848038E|nr:MULTISPECIES: MFS transporter [Enterobacterales]WOO50207.1 MFS transporter [Hafnia alvei]ODQ06855.1 MFS transporter [Shigella sp. FC130]OEI94827.1 MFS transporter [Shigella sp. FC1655]OEJ08268.1 MFS transporter [Shigella sp. FC1967]WPF04671.1 MFS transporter [Proteus vulgaris]
MSSNIIPDLQQKKTWKARYTVLSLIWLAWLLSFLDRMVMSVSLPFIGRDLNLDTTQQGLIISAFFVGYAAFQIPGGFLADRFGARKIMAIGIAWWSVFTSLTGMVFTLPLMLAVRFLFGIGEGCFPSASWKMISTYFPSKERGRATAIQSTVNTLGPALAVIVAASIIGAFGWHMVFIVLGIPGLLIAAGIYFFTRDNPKDHPSITQQDLDELAADGTLSDKPAEAVPFKDVLKMPVLWQMAAIWFLFDITFWGFSTWLPSYLITVREFSLAKTGVMAAIPFLFGAGGTLLGGYVSDKCKSQRKWLYMITAVIAAGFLYMTYTVESADMAVVYQCISALFMFFAMAMFWGILMDTIPNKIMGRASGIVNFGGQMAGVVSAPVMGFLIKASGGSYDSAFMFMIIALVASAVVTFTVKMKNTPAQA